MSYGVLYVVRDWRNRVKGVWYDPSRVQDFRGGGVATNTLLEILTGHVVPMASPGQRVVAELIGSVVDGVNDEGDTGEQLRRVDVMVAQEEGV